MIILKTLKFVHCADIHLDAPIRDHGKGAYADIRRRDIKDAFNKILNRAKQEAAQLLLISGDLYEHRTVSKSTMEWIYMVLSGARVPIVIIPGNHDPFVANSWYKNWDWPDNVTILSQEKPTIMIESLNTNIYGMGFSSFKEDEPDLTIVEPPMKDKFNIFMFHGTLDMNFTKQAYKPVTSKALEALGYDYYALGHFHKSCEEYPLKNAYNPGSPEPLSFGEQGVHGAYMVTMEKGKLGVNVSAKKFATANREYHDTSLDISNCKNLDEVKVHILDLLGGFNPEKDLVRIKLKGRTHLLLEDEILSSYLGENWLYLKIINNTRKAFDLEELVNNPSLAGAFASEMKKRIEKVWEALDTNPNDESLQKEEEILGLSLGFGLEALMTGKIEWPSEE